MASRSQPGAGPDGGLRLPERYRLRRHLATGGMASVWCAEDAMLGRTVAIKVLAERFRHDEMAMRRFKREARAAARVSTHAHVVTIFDVGDLGPAETGAAVGMGAAGSMGPAEGPRPFIVMEYLAGGTVADAIRVGAVGRQEALRWIREAASALDHAHAAGIVHRDIKPANFLLDRSRVLHVADFGIARLVSEDTISTADELFGTAAYLAPEQALGRPATGASDLYALAVASFELLTGARPFPAAHFAAQARQHIEDPPPRASERDRTLPPFVDDVLAQGMAKQPEDRYGSGAEFVDALESAMSGGVPLASIASPTRRVRLSPLIPASGPVPPPAIALAAARAATDRKAAVPPSPAAPRHGRALALAALLVAVAAVGAIALAGTGGQGRRAARVTAASRPSTAALPVATTEQPVTHHVRHHRSAAAAPTGASGTPTTLAQAAAPTAQQLQLAGHEEMLAGNYQTAIATLHRAISSAAPGSLTYAYGLYDLARTLVMTGNPSAAVPILRARLKIPNQTRVVRQMLNQALRASGQVPAELATVPASGSPSSGSGSSTATRGGSSTSSSSTSSSSSSSPGTPAHHHPAHPPQPPASTGGAGLAPVHGPHRSSTPASGHGHGHGESRDAASLVE